MNCPHCGEPMEPEDWLESPITGEMVATGYDCPNSCEYEEYLKAKGEKRF